MASDEYGDFRLRGIPESFQDRKKVGELVRTALQLDEGAEIVVHSLARNPLERGSRIATLTFEKNIPKVLEGPQTEWVFTVPGSDEDEAEKWGPQRLVFDTHFRGFTPLHRSDDSECSTDLIAISGLAGHAFRSFKARESSFMWLRDDLPVRLQQTRILVYGYDTKVVASSSFQNLNDLGNMFWYSIKRLQLGSSVRETLHTNLFQAIPSQESSEIRPTVFLGHSLGGLIIKEAVMKMNGSKKAEDKSFLDNLIAIMFFGVPHQGMATEHLFPMLGEQPSRSLIQSLGKHSAILRRYEEVFSEALEARQPRPEILAFYETEMSPTARFNDERQIWESDENRLAVLVDRSSATNGSTSGCPIARNHWEMVKFTSEMDEMYDIVLDSLLPLLDDKNVVSKLLSENQRDCLKSLSFSEQNFRQAEIHDAENTCAWLLDDPRYQNWIRQPRGLLWVKGKPGAGKSVLMKYAAEKLREKTSGPREVVASFYIDGRGVNLQKTVTGVYRALLHDLIPYFNDALSQATLLFDEKESRYGSYHEGRWEWTERELEKLLLQVLTHASAMRRIVIFIDALDECEKDAPIKLSTCLKRFGEQIRQQNSYAKICFSSRHYPILGQAHVPTIVVENQNREDIRRVIEERLRDIEPEERQQIVDVILSKDDGVFQWAVFVADKAFEKYVKGFGLRGIEREIEKLPAELDSLYAGLLGQVNEDESERLQAIKLFRCVLSASRPLTVRELREALATNPHDTISESHDYGNYAEPVERFERRVIDLSKGLIHFNTRDGYESIGPDDEGSSRQAEFIHPSVRDYVLEHFIKPAELFDDNSHSSVGYHIEPPDVAQSATARDTLMTSPKEQTSTAPMSSSASIAELVEAGSIFSSANPSTHPTSVEVQNTGLANEAPEKTTDDVDSIYSVESDKEADSGYINEVAHIIFQQLKDNFLDITSFKSVLIVVERALEAFASKLGHELGCKQAQEARVFIQKHRRSIRNSLETIGYRRLQNVEEDNTIDRKLDEMNRANVLGWLQGTNQEHTPLEDNTENKHSGEVPGDDNLDFIDQEYGKDVEERGQYLEQIRLEHQELIGSGAFRWLIMRLKREMFMTAPTADHASSIAEEMLRNLVSKGKVSRKSPIESHGAVFTIDWDPLAFLEEQDYEEGWSEALAGAITLTGCASFAQALTCAEYMHQTWPCSGLSTLHAFQHMVERKQGSHTTQQDASKPELSAFMHERKVKVYVKGVAYTIAEIAEQLAWLGSALRSSPYDNGVAVCVPQISIDSTKPSEDPRCKTDIQCTLKFHIEPQAKSPLGERGVCWHKLFRNPVIVQGFPVPHQVCRTLGLDIPLNTMARLAQARRVTKFDNKLYAKGFSTMLLATKYNKDEGLIFWHLFYNKNKSHISYLDIRIRETEKVAADEISFQELENSRHILGWCSQVQNWAGAHDSQYRIRSSGRREPHTGCSFEKFSITGGKIVNFGLSGAIGVKDVPIHLNRNGSYFEMIKTVFSKFVVFYDVDEKRAWLVNGASALLHLVRSSLEDDRQSVVGTKLLFKDEKLQRAEHEYTPESAVDVLINEENMVLEIFPHKGEFSEELTSGAFDRPDRVRKTKRTCVLLQDRVEQVSHFLEQILVYQTDKAKSPGIEFKGRPRNYLEGFEFNAVANGSDPIVLKITDLRSTGRCWIDFARAINAVALFGRGFGDIIRPEANGETCHPWITMPTGKDYLAVCVPDLRRIIEEHGDMEGKSVRVVDDIYWHNPDKIFESCLCKGKSIKNTCTRAQVLLPSRFDLRRLTNRVVRPESWKDSSQGAIIFGHNPRFPLKWPDEPDKDPEEAQSEAADEEDLRSGVENVSSTGGSGPPERGVSVSSVMQDQPPADPSSELTSNTTIQSPSHQEGSEGGGVADMAPGSEVQRLVESGLRRRKFMEDHWKGLLKKAKR